MNDGRRIVAAVLCVTGMLVGACGGSDGGTHDGSPRDHDADPAVDGGTSPGDGGASTDGADGGGVAPPPPAPCSREAEARPAPASLFDTFLNDAAALAGAARGARVDRLLADVAAQGGTPLEDPASGRTVFLARGPGPWSVTTSLVGFDPAQATPLVAVPDTDLWAAQVTIPRGQSFRYRLLAGAAGASGATPVEDRRARTVVWDGVARAEGDLTPGSFDAIGHAMDWDKARGRLVRHGAVHAAKLGNDRDVLVYLPPRYDDATCTKLPWVVLHDGNEALTRGDMAHAADVLYAARPELSAVLVFAANAGTLALRADEYSFGFASSKGNDYLDFLVADLAPSITGAGVRVCSKPTARGLAGASLGGLVSTYAAYEKPGQWGWIGAQSASYFWNGNAMITRVAEAPKVDARFYLDSGDDNAEYVDQMAAAMTSKGYDFVRITQSGGAHQWASFATRFAAMLTHFRDGKSDCD